MFPFWEIDVQWKMFNSSVAGEIALSRSKATDNARVDVLDGAGARGAVSVVDDY
jgi:hypothetical protein